MMFKRDLSAARADLKRDGYVLLRDVLSDGFLDTLRDFFERSRAGTVAEYGQWRIGGKKHQFLYEFPDGETAEEFRRGIAALTGLAADRLTISERHLKQYEEDAPDFPAPHKDRGASHYSIGFPIHLGRETSVCVFPALDRTPNDSERAVFLTAQDHPGTKTSTIRPRPCFCGRRSAT